MDPRSKLRLKNPIPFKEKWDGSEISRSGKGRNLFVYFELFQLDQVHPENISGR
jgi:hypothetical protein